MQQKGQVDDGRAEDERAAADCSKNREMALTTYRLPQDKLFGDEGCKFSLYHRPIRQTYWQEHSDTPEDKNSTSGELKT
ncbi:hypothetical protein GJ744_006861 [Endocarpon pusillum]|uniref:Uncharacterized protein n=1 Tax=Endocarpon pusillum TaxID=364733 RepID=A0A8H7ASJ3_9EURO|nr:hypothetical protein GJ744_006861 [Endocarpon pusillum]